jgi:uncharacterized protein (TIGR00304 family)
MKDLFKIGVALIIIGFALILIGMLLSIQNTAFGGLIMIGPIPIAFGSSTGITVIAMVIGLLLMLVYFIGMMHSAEKSAGLEERSIPYQEIKEKKVKGGGVILIGPIPVVFGTDKKYVVLLMILAIVLMLLMVIFMKF